MIQHFFSIHKVAMTTSLPSSLPLLFLLLSFTHGGRDGGGREEGGGGVWTVEGNLSLPLLLPPLPLCGEWGMRGPCLHQAPTLMGWEEAHRYCRGKNGYLVSREDRKRLILLSDQTQDGTQPPTTVLPTTTDIPTTTTDIPTTSTTLTWTSLAPVEGHYQWLSLTPAVSDFVNWTRQPHPWERECAAYDVTSETFELHDCADQLPFFCVLDPSHEEQDLSDVELRVEGNMASTLGWFNLDPESFENLVLSCGAYSKTTGRRLATHPSVVWRKDQIYTGHSSDGLEPATLHDPTKSEVILPGATAVSSRAGRTANISLRQGTYWCEAWHKGSEKLLRSNKVLVTLSDHLVFILQANTYEDPGVGINDATDRLRETFRQEFPNISHYLLDPVVVRKDDDEEEPGKVLARYIFHLHIPTEHLIMSGMAQFSNPYRMNRYKECYQRNGYLPSSSLSFPTYCVRQHKYDLHWPRSYAGNINPLDFQCRERYGKLRAGRCVWDYTYGAYLTFDTTNCQMVDLCPQGHTLLGDEWCVSLSSQMAWRPAFNVAYKTGQEMSLLDDPTFLRPSTSSGLYNLIQELVRNETGSREVWLPMKRVRRYGPLTNLGPTNLNLTHYSALQEFNIHWAEGHPGGEKNCLALNLDTNTLCTTYCNTNISLPFVSIINATLFKGSPNHSANSLVTNSSQCLDGWQSTQLTEDLICFKLFTPPTNLTWVQASEFCGSHDAQLPSPNVGFLDWVYRQYLYMNQVEEVWMGAWARPDRIWYNGSMDKLNWLAETDYSKTFGLLRQDGWILEDKTSTKRNVLCQQVRAPDTDLKIVISKPNIAASQRMCISVEPMKLLSDDENTNLRCYVNGEYTKHERTNSAVCPFELRVSGQGYYECFAWSNKPTHLVQSNIVLQEDPGTFTFIISLSRDHDYRPEEHDRTFMLPRIPSTCSDVLLAHLRTNSQVNDQLRFTRKNFIYKPGQGGSKLVQNFHLECRLKTDTTNLTENKVLKALKDLLPIGSKYSDCTLEEIQSTVGCQREQTPNYGFNGGNLTWPKTSGKSVVIPEELCVTQDGEAVTRECIGDFRMGYRWMEAGSCTGQPTNITRRLWKIKNNTEGYLTRPASDKDDPSSLPATTSNSQALQPIDIHLIAETFQSFTHHDISTMDLDEIVEVLNNVMGANSETFEKAQRKLNSSGTLLEAFETLTFKVKLPDSQGDQTKNSSKELISVERLDLHVNSTIVGYKSAKTTEKMEAQSLLLKGVTLEDLIDAEAAIILPNNLTFSLAQKSSREARNRVIPTDDEPKLPLTFAVYRNEKLFYDSSISKKYVVNSQIIQASFKEMTVQNLEHPVKIYFKTHVKGNDTKCVFWDFSRNENQGGWSEEGCWKGDKKGVNGQEVCYCNHLTSFAHLINYEENSGIDGVHADILDTITIIGCCLSILSLLLVFTTFFLFKKWQKSITSKILVSLSFSVFCSLVVFVAGIDQTWNDALCRSVAVALHYFILASFGWMLVEGVHQYLKFVKVVPYYIPRFMWKASVCAWGIPILPVLALLIYDASIYDSRTDDHLTICWMSPYGFKIAFLPPLVITMTINLLIFAMIIRGAVCGRARITSTLSDRDLFLTQLSMSICVFFLLGFTWIFGLLAVSGARLVFSYLFCIFNTLQGFFLFLFHVLRDRTARKYWRDFLSILTNEPVSSTPGNSINTPGSGHMKTDSVIYEKYGGILVIPQGPTHPLQLQRQSIRTSLLSAGTISTTNSRVSYVP